MVPNLVNFNPSAFALYSQLWQYYGGRPPISTTWLLRPEDRNLAMHCHYVIIRSEIEASASDFEREFSLWLTTDQKEFVKIGEFPLTTLKAKALIYERVNTDHDK